MALRFDITKLDDPRRDHNGYLVADAHATRTGVFVYHHPDGTTTRELRHPDEVFKPDSIASLKHRPVTDGHPPDMKLNSENTRRLAVGMSIDEPKQNDRYIDTQIQLTDEDVISRVLADEDPLREMSCGYEAKITKADGTYQGEKYDHVQSNIKYNHLALVRRGRAGHEVRLMLDAADAASDGLEDIVKIDVEETKDKIHIPVRDDKLFKKGSFRTMKLKGATGVSLVVARLEKPPKSQKGSAVAQKYIFDKKHFTTEQAKAFIAKHRNDESELVKTGKINQTSKRNTRLKLPKPRGDSDMIKIKRDAINIRAFKLDAFEVQIEDNVDSGEQAAETILDKLDITIAHIRTLEGDKDNLQGRLDALKDQGKVSLTKLNDLVKERTDVVNAAHYLGLNDFMDMETDELKRAVVVKAYPQSKIDEQTKDHIEGRYSTVVEGIKDENKNMRSLQELNSPPASKNMRFIVKGDEVDPRTQFLEDTKDMYLSKEQQKLNAGAGQ